MANHSANFKIEYLIYSKLPDNVKVVYLYKNDELTEDTSGCIPVSSQNIKDVSSCDDNKRVSGKDNQQNNNHNHLLSLDNVGVSQTIGGIGNYMEPKFHSTGFFSNFQSHEMDIMFADNVEFEICLSCELIFGKSCSLDNVGLNSFLSSELPMTVIFIFLFDGTFMEAGYNYNLLSLVDNIRVSLNDAFLDGFLIHLHNATAIEE